MLISFFVILQLEMFRSSFLLNNRYTVIRLTSERVDLFALVCNV